MSSTGLDLSIIDNPVGATCTVRLSAEDLVELPPQLTRTAALLSTAEGKPTLLFKVLMFVLVAFPFQSCFLAFHYDAYDPTPNVFEAAKSGDMQLVTLIVGWWFLGYLLPGPAALVSLRLVTRPRNGHLAQLCNCSGGARVSRRSLESLKWWGRALWFMVVFFLIGLYLAYDKIFSAKLGRGLATGIEFLVHSAVFFPVMFTWWYSLKVASALVDVPITKVSWSARDEAKRMRESGEPIMDPERWQSLIEEPVLELICETLPTLSEGWGPSVGLVATGLACLAVGAIGYLLDYVLKYLKQNWQLATALGLLIGFAAMPFALVLGPAAASSKCAKLEDSINLLSVRDTNFAPATNFLKNLKALNKDQGLGFVVAGQVVTKRTVWLAMTAMYGVVAAFAPTYLGEVGLATSCVAGSSTQHPACEFGWTFANNKCFKLFGDGVIGEPLNWVDANEMCEKMGPHQTHLASITSKEQQRAVQRIAGGIISWIGLNDPTEGRKRSWRGRAGDESTFSWSDGAAFNCDLDSDGKLLEPLNCPWDDEEGGFWAPGEPGRNSDGKYAVLIKVNGGWGDSPAEGKPQQKEDTLRAYICATRAIPVTASAGEMNGCADGRWVMGTPYKQPRSLGRLPPTIVREMYEDYILDEIAAKNDTLRNPRDPRGEFATAAECAAVVYRDRPIANAAMYSNDGGGECWAVFDAAGVIYDPMLQTCLFS